MKPAISNGRIREDVDQAAKAAGWMGKVTALSTVLPKSYTEFPGNRLLCTLEAVGIFLNHLPGSSLKRWKREAGSQLGEASDIKKSPQTPRLIHRVRLRIIASAAQPVRAPNTKKPLSVVATS